MSIKIMSAVWESSLAPMERLVLLAYADHADHAGNNVYPSLGTIARKTGLERRSVMRIRKRLEKMKVMVATAHVKRQPTCFRVDTGSLPRDTTPLEEDRDTESLGTLSALPRDTGSPKPSYKPSKEKGTKLSKDVARASRGADAEKLPPIYGPLFVAIAEICKLDPKHAPSSKQISDAAKFLAAKDGIKVEHVTRFAEWFGENDFRGRDGSPPRPGWVCSEWRKFVEGVKTRNAKTTGPRPHFEQPAGGFMDRVAKSLDFLNEGGDGK